MRDRFRGCLLGMACGDALGAGIVHQAPEAVHARFGVVTNFADGGPRNWKLGAVSDNSELSFLLGESFCLHPAVSVPDIAERWLEWMDDTSHEVGGLTRDALIRVRACLQEGRDPQEGGKAAWEMTSRQAAGNGGMVRSAPIGMRFCQQRNALVHWADYLCSLTHYDPRCRGSALVFCLALQQLLTAEEERGILDLKELADTVHSLSPETEQAVLDVFDLDLKDVPSDAYTLSTLQAALWPVERGMKLEDGIITTVNLGKDADTYGAVTGALLGARDGEAAIPKRWLDNLCGVDRIRQLADRLHALVASES